MSFKGQGHFFTIYFPGFVCFVLYLAKISGERLQDHWSSGFSPELHYLFCYEAVLIFQIWMNVQIITTIVTHT